MTEIGSDQGEMPPEDPMAAEFALGLLEGDDRAAATRRMLTDPTFALEVEGWRMRFSPLHDAVQDEIPSPRLWPLIEARLDGNTQSTVVIRLRRWRALALISMSIAASLGAFMIFGPVTQPAPVASPMMVAQIAADDAGPVMLASYDRITRRFRVIPSIMEAKGHSPQLWLIPADGKPRSLGIFDPTRPTDMVVPEPITHLIDADSIIAVSIEPLGGSRTDQPTGPVVAKGKMLPI